MYVAASTGEDAATAVRRVVQGAYAAPAASGNTVEFREDFLLYRPTWSTPEMWDRLRRQSAGPSPR